MSNAELTDAHTTLLRALMLLEEQHAVATVHQAANVARMSYMDAYDLVNGLFAAGYINHELKVTDAGKKAVK